MDYIFGTDRVDGQMFENLKTVGDEHTDLSGYVETRRVYDDRVICDRFRVVEKYGQAENSEKKYDLYRIEEHYRYTEITQEMRALINDASIAGKTSFIALSEKGDIDKAVMIENARLFDKWAPNTKYKAGDIRSETIDMGLKLYKCQQAHTSQEGWNPAATPALWVVVDVEHAGTQDDPIPASRGMEYTYGLYYLDSEDGKAYLCERTGEAAGGKIVLQYLPHELVGQYFTEVE